LPRQQSRVLEMKLIYGKRLTAICFKADCLFLFGESCIYEFFMKSVSNAYTSAKNT
jgi:hypothetical protein